MTDQHQPPAAPRPWSPDQRKAALAQAVGQQAAYGLRVESQTDYQAVLVKGKPVNHILHVIVSLVTCGIWVLVWAALAIFGGEQRIVLAVDDYGNVLRR